MSADVTETGPGEAETAKKVTPTSRRSFLLGATAAGGLLPLQTAAAKAATTAPADHAITVPAEFATAANTALPKITFPMTGADVFAAACKNEEVAALLCCPGNYKVIHAIAEQGIPVYSGRNELAMCAAADAFIRITGEMAVTSGTEGPGFTTMIMGIANANAARTPLLVLASNTSVKDDDTEAGIQVGEQQSVTTNLRKYGKRLITPQRVHEYAGYAFRQLRTGIPRPVHIDFTNEVTDARFKSAGDLSFFFDKTKYRSESKPYPNPADIKTAIQMLGAAKRPIIVSSTGVFYSKAWDALRKFAEKASIPVCESGAMRGQFPDDHPLSADRSPTALSSADLVFFVGQYCMPTIGEYAFGPEAKYIRIQPTAEDVGRNIPIDLGIVADERATMEALAEAASAASRPDWLNEIHAARAKFEDENEAIYKLGAAFGDAVHPAVIGKELAAFLQGGNIPKEQTTIAQGGFGIARYTRRWLRAFRPGQIMNGNYQYGPVGLDIGYTVGVAAAVRQGAGVQAPYKGKPIVCITGDAGFGYTGLEVETMAKYRMPVVIIIYNNNAWGTWYPQADEVHRAPIHLFQENLRYDKVAEALGGRGEYVTRPEDFRPALERAWKVASEESLPVVINCQGRKEFWLRSKTSPGFLGKVEPGCMSYYH
ncbi:thiamine pyrophosphate-binding protein [Methylobacterium brachythecii]|nr:thiamine pyrophosphate-binding protein [Methylobacterium brachythecii]MBB3901392.1 thiamine pyrophosphate-dependent acetolactate synthase large subunit-like protein [Methylobacterium brachythecii]